MARRHHFIGNHNGTDRARSIACSLNELGISWQTSSRALHRFKDNGRQFARMFLDNDLCCVGVVIRRDHKFIRSVPWCWTTHEIQNPSVISPRKDQHLTTAGCLNGRSDCHEIGFGARVSKTHSVDTESRTHQSTQLGFGWMNSTNTHIVGKCCDHGIEDPPFAVTQQTGGVVA